MVRGRLIYVVRFIGQFPSNSRNGSGLRLVGGYFKWRILNFGDQCNKNVGG